MSIEKETKIKPGPQGPAINPLLLAEVRQLAEAGVPYMEISAKLGVHRPHIYRWAQRYNWRTPRRMNDLIKKYGLSDKLSGLREGDNGPARVRALLAGVADADDAGVKNLSPTELWERACKLADSGRASTDLHLAEDCKNLPDIALLRAKALAREQGHGLGHDGPVGQLPRADVCQNGTVLGQSGAVDTGGVLEEGAEGQPSPSSAQISPDLAKFDHLFPENTPDLAKFDHVPVVPDVSQVCQNGTVTPPKSVPKLAPQGQKVCQNGTPRPAGGTLSLAAVEGILEPGTRARSNEQFVDTVGEKERAPTVLEVIPKDYEGYSQLVRDADGMLRAEEVRGSAYRENITRALLKLSQYAVCLAEDDPRSALLVMKDIDKLDKMAGRRFGLDKDQKDTGTSDALKRLSEAEEDGEDIIELE